MLRSGRTSPPPPYGCQSRISGQVWEPQKNIPKTTNSTTSYGAPSVQYTAVRTIVYYLVVLGGEGVADSQPPPRRIFIRHSI